MTGKHILIAVNNCGSSYGWTLLLDTCGGRMMTATRHAPVRAVLPEWRRGRRTIGLQRNPFAWYVTGWHKDHVLQQARGAVPVGFDEWFWDINSRPWRYIPEEYRSGPPVHVRFAAYTYFHLHYCLRNAPEVFADCRTMADVDAAYDAGLGIDDWVFAHTYYQDFARILGRPLVIDRTRTLNAHPHGPYRDYYDAAKRRHVEENDAMLLRRYGYSWDGPEYCSAGHKYPPMPSEIAVEKGSREEEALRCRTC